MGKILVTVGAISALGFLAYKTLYGRSDSVQADTTYREPSAPKQTLDNVRTKAKSIEANDDAYAKHAEEETKSP